MERKQLQFSADETVLMTEKLIDALVNIRDENGAFLMTLADGRVVDTKGWGGWEWTHGVGLYGLWQYWQQTRDPRWLAIIEQWFTDRFREGTPTKNVNTMAPMLTLASVYEENGYTPWKRYIECWANWVMYDMPRTELGGLQHMTFNYAHHQQLWDDTLMMSVMPLAKAGLVLNRPEWVAEAKRQFLLHSQYLCDAPTGLWYHGWNFEGRHHYAKALWGRGNSWVTVAIPDFIEMLDLPQGDPVREFLLGQLSRQVAALAERQDKESGLWHTLLDDPTSYLESSASAGFAYGILKAVRKRYIDKRFLATGVAAAEGVMRQITPQGELANVSFGTGMGKDLDYYRNIERTSMPYGQAMAMLALIEYQNLFI